MSYAPLVNLDERTSKITRWLASLPPRANLQNGSGRATLLAVAIMQPVTAAEIAPVVGQAVGTVSGKLRAWEADGVVKRHPGHLRYWSIDPQWLRDNR